MGLTVAIHQKTHNNPSCSYMLTCHQTNRTLNSVAWEWRRAEKGWREDLNFIEIKLEPNHMQVFFLVHHHHPLTAHIHGKSPSRRRSQTRLTLRPRRRRRRRHLNILSPSLRAGGTHSDSHAVYWTDGTEDKRHFGSYIVARRGNGGWTIRHVLFCSVLFPNERLALFFVNEHGGMEVRWMVINKSR